MAFQKKPEPQVVPSWANLSLQAAAEMFDRGERYNFRPARNLTKEVGGFMNSYKQGEVYSVRPGNKSLHRLVREWVSAQEVELGLRVGNSGMLFTVQGNGIVR